MPGLNLVTCTLPKVAFGAWLGVLPMALANPTSIFTVQACWWMMLAGALIFASSWQFILSELDNVAPTVLPEFRAANLGACATGQPDGR